MAIWRRYLLVGLGVSALCVALPLGVGRDALYCLIGASAISVGLLAWVFLITPTWTAYDEPMFNRLVGIAYPLSTCCSSPC